jgi:lysophospholipase L1-like esterase
MPSSTFASDPRAAPRAIVLLLAALLAYLLGLEVAMRTVLPRISETQRRMAQDARAVALLQPQSAAGAHTVLLVGNSLLAQGIDRQRLQQGMRPDYAVTYYPIEGTTYLDWLYGLRRLFAEGARPAAVVLCISGRQLLSNDTFGETFARRLLQVHDLPDLVRVAHLNMMSASAYFFANKSAWLGARSAFRDGLLQKWLPRSDLLAARLTPVDPLPLLVNDQTLRRAVERLSDLQALAAKYGAEFVFLLPPTLNTNDISPVLASRARSVHIPVLVPYRPGEMPRDKFVDGFHLNSQGATDFSARVAPVLLEALAQRVPSAPAPATPPREP